MSAHHRCSRRILAATITSLFACAGARAGQLDYTLYTGIEHSDNITLSATDPISQSTLIPGATFRFDQQGEDLQAHVLGSIEYRDYLGSRFSNQTQTQLSGQANWSISPQRLDFVVEDYAAVQPVDSTVSNSPTNLQQTNVLSLGPTLRFDLASAWHGQVDARYIDSRAQKTKQFDSQRGQFAARLIHDFSHSDVGSLNAETQKVHYTSALPGSDYRRDQFFGRYQGSSAHTELDVSAGWTHLQFDQGSPRSYSGSMLSATGTWHPSETNSLSVNLARQYTDAAQSMLEPDLTSPVEGRGGIVTGQTVVGPQVYLERRGELAYAWRSDRLTFSLAPYYRKLSYVNDTTYDQVGKGANVGLDYKFRPTLLLSAYVNGERLRYDTLNRLDRTVSYEVALTDQRTVHWSWRVSFLHQQRHSDAAGQSFHENRIYVGVIFRR
ncbi:hypothetical protein ATSB10_35460 [Dyella thiooxydans]|uniref:Porin domain-containing protein n=1 Tax=Dyella thiooxydans TaxID=445710 RepID=A0A160N4V8_9GAMM|nr:outer membrane beta-barrel protein [Dyella thiooxydans]AND71000.1 hypothetical protein ATSB10_35460 [Dyella thiooxydans]